MKINKVHFANFWVEPEKIFAALPQYQKPYWPKDWTVVVVRQPDNLESVLESVSTRVNNWINEKTEGKAEICNISSGGTLVAFEDETDAVMFKISFNGAV